MSIHLFFKRSVMQRVFAWLVLIASFFVAALVGGYVFIIGGIAKVATASTAIPLYTSPIALGLIMIAGGVAIALLVVGAGFQLASIIGGPSFYKEGLGKS